jgi:phosphoribosyl 1,2-cyclic phosphate phosphodiesterase
MKADIEAYADAKTWSEIERRFGYVLEPLSAKADFYYKPCLVPHTIAPGDEFRIGPVTVLAIDQDHGFSRTLGLRFGRFAYSTDLVELPEAGFAALAGVEVWIVGCLRPTPHSTHAHVDKAVAWIERVGAKRAYLTHMNHSIDYQTLKRQLPSHIEPAYDGLVIDI